MTRSAYNEAGRAVHIETPLRKRLRSTICRNVSVIMYYFFRLFLVLPGIQWSPLPIDQLCAHG